MTLVSGVIIVIILLVGIINLVSVDDRAYLEENALTPLRYPEPIYNVLDVAFIEDDYAIVFYEWGNMNLRMFGIAEMEKNSGD